MRVGKDRRQKKIKSMLHIHPAANERKDRQNEKRTKHYPRTLVRLAMTVPMLFSLVMHGVRVRGLMGNIVGRRAAAIFTKESHEPQTEHVKGSNERGDHSDQP